MFFMNIFVHTRECDRSNHQVGVELVINEKIIGFQGKHKVKLCTIYKYVSGVFWLKNIAMKIIHLQVGFFHRKSVVVGYSLSPERKQIIYLIKYLSNNYIYIWINTLINYLLSMLYTRIRLYFMSLPMQLKGGPMWAIQ